MAKNNQTLGIIPSRFASTRFPGKPLVKIRGKSMVQRVYEQAQKCPALDAVVVATDDDRIAAHVQSFGRVAMTSEFHTTGTDRCAEVVQMPEFADFQKIVNIQGDEPFIHPEQIAQAVSIFEKNESAKIGTLVKRIKRAEDLTNPNVVKVVFGVDKKAIYFSRSPIPYFREKKQQEWLSSHAYFKHIGLYAFRREVLLEIPHLPKGKLESAESLEQLRWLEAGISIGLGITEHETQGIDSPEDLERLEEFFSKSEIKE